jgi:2-oxoglutarate ferredoxin oxidoreductase subunit alpha
LLLKTKPTLKFFQGNQACARAAIDCGVRFFAGYPITPSSEIAEILSRELPLVQGKFIQMEDEIASLGAVLGGSLAGLKSMTATSGPGFSLMQELLGFACLCEIPCLIVSVQRGGPSTGLPTSPSQSDVMQSRWGTHGDHPIIVLAPSSVKEMYDLTVKGINLAESLRTPVILLADEVIGHMYEKIEFPSPGSLELLNRPKPKKVSAKKYLPYEVSSPKQVPAIADFGQGFHFNVTGLIHDTDGFPVNNPDKTQNLLDRLHEKINSRLADICLFESQNLKQSIILCSYGATARSALEAVQEVSKQGLDVGLIKLKTLWPFPDFIFESIKGKNKAVIVCEMNRGQVLGEVQRSSGGRFKVSGVNSARGTMITPQEIIKEIKQVQKCLKR